MPAQRIAAHLLKTIGHSTNIFSYSDTFPELWKAIDDLAIKKNTRGIAILQSPVFIIWDGIDLSSKEAQFGYENYLTAFDWVIALIAVVDRLRSDTQHDLSDNLRIHILDTTCSAEWSRSFARKILAVIRDANPWIDICGLEEDGVSRFLSALRSPKPPMDVPKPDSIDLVLSRRKFHSLAQTLRRLWQSELTRPEARHSISNAVGPLALLVGLAEKNFAAANNILNNAKIDKKLSFHFWRLLEALELLPPLIVSARTTGRDPGLLGGLENSRAILEDSFGRFRNLRFALVDDQAESGFHDALAIFLLGTSFHKAKKSACTEAQAIASSSPALVSRDDGERHRLVSFSEPSILVAWLERVFSDRLNEPLYRPRLYGSLKGSFGTNCDDFTQFDILLLDLRLYGIDDVSGAKARYVETLSRLIDLYEVKIHAMASHEDFGLSPHKLDALLRAVASARSHSKQGDSLDFAYLCLLPVLISVCDPTIPIILFSSSRQRGILDLVKPFPNIITSFSKPGTTGYLEDRLALNWCVDGLKDALTQALAIHEKRLVWDLLDRFSFQQNAVAPVCVFRDTPKTANPVVCNLRQTGGVTSTPLPFPDTRDYDVFFFGVIRDFILNESSLEHIFRLYELTELSLLAKSRASGLKRSSISLDSYDIYESITKQWPGITTGVGDKTNVDWMQRIKTARNQYVHGYLTVQETPSDTLQTVGLGVLLLFLRVISDDGLENAFRDRAMRGTDFIQVVAGATPARALIGFRQEITQYALRLLK